MDEHQENQNTEENNSEEQGSVYSFSYKDLNNGTHEGDYNARRDSNESIFEESDTSADSSWGSGSGVYGRQSSGTSESGSGQTAGDDAARGAAQQSAGPQNGGQSRNEGQSGRSAGSRQSGPENVHSTQNHRYSYQPDPDQQYRSAEPEKKERHIYRKPKRRPGLRTGGGFLQTLVKCVCLAVIFGLVAGGIMYGMNRKTVLAVQQAAIDQQNAASEAAEKSSAETGSSGSTDSQTSDSSLPAGVSDGAAASVVAVDLTDMVEEVMPSVVSISNISEQEYYDWFGRSQTYESEGVASGILVAEDDNSYFIATNNHVVEGSTSLTVTFCDDSVVSGEIKGTAANNDLAVVRVAKKDVTEETRAAIKVAKLGDSSELKVGETAVAIGNALGYGQSVTVGVISALNRQITSTDSSSGTTYSATSLIQTDAAINPGNSGGALLNIYGEVIGINSAKYSDTAVEGMGYAIPITIAQPIIDDLIVREEVSEDERAFLGISGADVDSASANTYGMPVGIYITQIYEDTAAASADLQKGDILTGFNDKIVATMEELQTEISYCRAGDKAKITYQRRGANGEYTENTVEVTLGERPADQ